MASPQSAPSTTPPPGGASTNSTSAATPPPASSPPSPPTSPPPNQSPPPASPPPNHSPPPASPPLNSSPPHNSSPPPSSPPPSPIPNSPPPASDSKSPPPQGTNPPPAAEAASSPPPPAATFTPPPPPGTHPLPKFSPPPPGTISAPTPPSPAEKLRPPSSERPPSQHRSPPNPPSDSKSPSSSSSSSSNTNTTPIIVAGIVVGGVVLLALLIVCLLCTKKKKKQPYYIQAGRPPKPGDPYYNAATPGQWNSALPMDHMVKHPPPGGVMGTPSPLAGGHWVAPPQPAANTSSEFSSGPYHVPNVASSSPNVGGMGGGLGFSKSQFSYEELAAATGGFSQINLLGQGGFGYVHKGVLPDGKEVAVKSLKAGSGQGEREFQAEVEIISRVHHRHLVSLVGYCIAGEQRMLVYEFVSNKTLEFHLHGKNQPVMDWKTRLQIALGSAKGLSYIHEDCHPRIIHRDIKAANILLDDKYEAMVADFGLAKLSSDNYTHVSTRVMGTFGYMAPEYASSGKLTDKSDVFSFGVMLLELITGRKPVDPTSNFMEDSLVDWARPLLNKALEDGNYDDIVDPRLEHNYATHEMARMITCASASIRHSARRRPKMSQIVRALEGDSSLEDLNEAPKAVANVGMGSGSTGTQTYDTGMYNADMVKFRNMVLSSQEFPSSEHGATSEYGLNPSASSSEDFGHPGQQRKKP